MEWLEHDPEGAVVYVVVGGKMGSIIKSDFVITGHLDIDGLVKRVEKIEKENRIVEKVRKRKAWVKRKRGK